MTAISCLFKHAITSVKTQFPVKCYINSSVKLGVVRSFSVGVKTNMKLVQFTYKNRPSDVKVGYLTGENVVDVNKADTSLPLTLLEILKSNVLDKVKK